MEELNEQFFEDLKQIFQSFKKSVQNEKRDDDTSGESGDTKEQSELVENYFNLLISKINAVLPKIPKDSNEYIKLLTMKASLFYEKAKINLSNNCIDNSQELLQNTLKEIEDNVDSSQITFLYLRIVNHLSYIYSRSGNLEKAMKLLEKVTKNDPTNNPHVYSTEDLFFNHQMNKTEATFKLNKLIVNNMQMLGWIYGKLGLADLHTDMQHQSLQKQIDIGDNNPIMWATRCSRLACLFLTQNKWVPARYHLAASETILNRLEIHVNVNPELNKAQAELARAWIQYGLHLFSVSKKNILEQIYTNEDTSYLSNEEQPEEEMLPSLQFNALIINFPNIPATQISTTSQARELFLHTQKWLKRSRLYYTLRDYPLQYVNSVLDLSELFRFLAFYEPDIDSQYNVQKKRYDALEALCAILKEVRPNCYFAVSVELLKELADVQIELMGLNLKRLYAAEGVILSEANLKQRINAVSGIHSKLDNLEDVLCSSSYETEHGCEDLPRENVTATTSEDDINSGTDTNIETN